MSLKAKIEAVIYAAEEPVTLAQLAAIFAAEVPVPNAQLPLPESLDSVLAATPEETESAGHEVTIIDESGDMMDIAPAIEEGAPRLSSEADDTVTVHAAEDSEATSPAQSAALMPSPREVRDYLRELVDELIADYNGPKSDRGIEIREIAGGYRMATKPEYHDAVRAFVKNLKPAMKLSQQALETLAVIAYKQPVTSPEIAEIRGVDSGGVLANLISRKLVTTAGRKQVIGRPILYKTTKEFLLGFGLKDLSELPSMEEFEKMAGELAASDALEAEAMNERAGLSAAPEDSEERVSKAQNELNGAPPHTANPEAAPENVPPGTGELMPEETTQRLQKIIAQAGIASRRKAEELILEGRVQLNGKVVTELGTKADPFKDHIRVDNKLLHGPEKHRYYMLNKPRGCVSTTSDPQKRPTVTQFFSRSKARVFPVGRLDYDSEGLLIVTNDGELTNGLTRASSKVEKTYLVKVSGIPPESKLEQIRRGIMIERGKPGTREGRVLTEPVKLTLVREADNPWYEVILTEGRNRQIRKLFEEIGHHVEKIRRIGYGPLVLDVEPGQFRELTEREIFLLTRASRHKAPAPGAPAPKPASMVNRPKKLLQKAESKVLPKPFKKAAAKKKRVRPGIKSAPKKQTPRFGSAFKKSRPKGRG